MIKINLLPARKIKRVAEPGQGAILVGMGGLFAAAVLMYLFVVRPASHELKNLDEANGEMSAQVAAQNAKLKDYKTLKAAVEAADARNASIEKLIKAKAVPAHMINELGQILTPGQLPTMSRDMSDKIGDGPHGDANKRFALDWDPKHVWITKFVESKGAFTLEGGAQADPDVTQLAKRMQASVFFTDVTPQGGERITDTATSVTYYKFTITGKVVY